MTLAILPPQKTIVKALSIIAKPTKTRIKRISLRLAGTCKYASAEDLSKR